MGKISSICILVSGGLDSGVLLAQMARQHGRVYPLYVKQGLAWEEAELYWLRRFILALKQRRIQPLRVFSLPLKDVYGAHWSLEKRAVPGARTPDKAVYLPGRNLVLALKPAIFCALHNIRRLVLGSLDHNPFTDATPRFFKEFSRTLSRGLGSPIALEAPYRRLSKAKVIRRGKGFPLELTYSCLAPAGRQHCGRCNKCAERRKAFRLAGVPDKTHYAKA